MDAMARMNLTPPDAMPVDQVRRVFCGDLLTRMVCEVTGLIELKQ